MSKYQGPSPTPSQAGCSVCSRLFGGVSGFDDHRAFDDHRNRVCLDPAEIGYIQDERGVWRRPMDQEKVAMFKERVRGARGRGDGA